LGVEVQGQNGKVLSSGSSLVYHDQRPNYKTNGASVSVAPNFYGYIKGIKYFRSVLRSYDPEYFGEAESPDSALLFYFRFDKESYDGDRTFVNGASKSGIDYEPLKFLDFAAQPDPSDPAQTVVT